MILWNWRWGYAPALRALWNWRGGIDRLIEKIELYEYETVGCVIINMK